jgi:hypothetical protein
LVSIAVGGTGAAFGSPLRVTGAIEVGVDSDVVGNGHLTASRPDLMHEAVLAPSTDLNAEPPDGVDMDGGLYVQVGREGVANWSGTFNYELGTIGGSPLVASYYFTVESDASFVRASVSFCTLPCDTYYEYAWFEDEMPFVRVGTTVPEPTSVSLLFLASVVVGCLRSSLQLFLN